MNDCKTVTLRTRPLKNKMLSFYLDYYPGYRDKETMKVIRHESLGIYIYYICQSEGQMRTGLQRGNWPRRLKPSVAAGSRR